MPKKGKPEKDNRIDARNLESISAKIGELLSGQNFESPEDVQKFLNEHVLGQQLDDLEMEPQSPSTKAQALMWDAFGEGSKKKRIAMAEKALTMDPDCADAYVLLAEDKARDNKQAIVFYRKGVEGAQRSLGDDLLQDKSHPFWIDHSTRPYMRALMGLACVLNGDNQIDEAIDIWQQLLKLNPSDNQGVRYFLAPVLVEKGRLKEAENLFKEFDDDDSAHMLYSKALFLFRKEGDTKRSEEAFWDAVDENGHVIDMMIGLTPLPDDEFDSYTPGSIEEAHSYILNAIRSWVKTKGAVEWTADLIMRDEEKEKLNKTFPGLLDAAPKNNVIDLKSFKSR